MYILSSSWAMIIPAIVAAAAFLPFVIKSFGGRIKSWFKHSKTVEKPPVSVIHQDK
ncbi:MAG: hypothetical protein ACLPVI_03405 [Dehalococcoidales bacterium]